MVSPECSKRLPLRLACFAYAEEHAGSVSSANYLMVRALLERGHEIDFFNKRSFINPIELRAYPSFRYVDCKDGFGEAVHQWTNAIPLAACRAVGGQILHRTFARSIVNAMAREHRSRNYDVQLSLGEAAFGRMGSVPVVSWLQGPPMTDGKSIRTRRQEIIQNCGYRAYVQFRVFSLWRSRIGLPPLRASDLIIVGSKWSHDNIGQFGVPAEKCVSLPYPIDLQAFGKRTSFVPSDEPVILWLGRVVPRKRLDLFLDACALLIDRGIRVRLKIIGGFAFVPGYKKLLDRFKYPERLKYVHAMDRTRVAELMRQTDLVLQPSEDENFASTPAEALACGVPVVLGRTNGTADYVDDAAEIFEEYTPASVAAATEKMLGRLRADPNGMAHLARAAAERHFDLARVVDQLESHLYHVVSSSTVVGG